MAKVKYYGTLRETIGKPGEDIPANSLRDLLDQIGALYGPKVRKAAARSLIVADGEKVLSVGKVILSDASVVGFFPLCGGG